MKVTMSFLALTLATFTSALPKAILSATDDFPVERRGGEGDPYAPKSVFHSRPYTQHKDDEGWGKEDPKMAKRSPVAHGGYGDHWQGDDNPAYDPNDPSTYSQEYWNSIGSDNPKKRSSVAHGGHRDWKGDDNPAYNPNDPSTYSQDYWNSIGSDNPKKRSAPTHEAGNDE